MKNAIIKYSKFRNTDAGKVFLFILWILSLNLAMVGGMIVISNIGYSIIDPANSLLVSAISGLVLVLFVLIVGFLTQPDFSCEPQKEMKNEK